MLQPISVPAQNQIPFIKIARKWDAEPLTLAWADSREQERVNVLAVRAGRQTMNLRRMPGAKLVVLRRSDGQFAGWRVWTSNQIHNAPSCSPSSYIPNSEVWDSAACSSMSGGRILIVEGIRQGSCGWSWT